MKAGFSADDLIRVCRALQVNPIEALLNLGYLSHDEVNSYLNLNRQPTDPKQALREATEESLVDEVLRRMKIPGMIKFLDQPVDELARRRYVRILQDELARVTYNENHMPNGAVAYSGPDEDQMRAAQEDDDHIP